MSSATAIDDATENSDPAPLSRVVGLDAARGLAVLGMFAVHVGPHPGEPGAGWLEIFSGRSSALFAVLAGVSLALLSGGERMPAGRAGRRVLVRIGARAVVIALIGLALVQLRTPVMVILFYYGVFFLLSLPLLRLRPRTLALIAFAWAIAGPIVSFLIRERLAQNSFGGSPAFAMFGSWSGVREAFEMTLLTGAYPVLTWMPFLLAGLALGRIGIRSMRPALPLGVGAALLALGYGGSWLAQHPLGGRRHLLDMLTAMLAESGTSLDAGKLLDAGGGFGAVPTTSWWWLTVASPHSGTPFDILGATGVAFAVLGALLAVAARLRAPLYPLIAAGSCALSLYVLQIVAIHLLMPVPDDPDVPLPDSGLHQPSWQLLTLFVAGSLLLATLWRSLFRRGPIEWALHELTLRFTTLLLPSRRPSANYSGT
ncbi:heparan-alpha-glucosaminide N-acetyltransferase domain-containing protein [Nocardia terpenica]|uniref:DUF418 domain-containing protein n=1 Tax=Nocardia terpenica TaxID=455432 RepID=A0A291RLX0_9NOCA|nr:heparan-alpha-glucosaminide N-acetyltransferase domain-containing protein [Nocardia terpenica]ATL68315.1 hypothetical protein CRH09_21155 [Nocardia terpenica]